MKSHSLDRNNDSQNIFVNNLMSEIGKNSFFQTFQSFEMQRNNKMSTTVNFNSARTTIKHKSKLNKTVGHIPSKSLDQKIKLKTKSPNMTFYVPLPQKTSCYMENLMEFSNSKDKSAFRPKAPCTTFPSLREKNNSAEMINFLHNIHKIVQKKKFELKSSKCYLEEREYFQDVKFAKIIKNLDFQSVAKELVDIRKQCHSSILHNDICNLVATLTKLVKYGFELLDSEIVALGLKMISQSLYKNAEFSKSFFFFNQLRIFGELSRDCIYKIDGLVGMSDCLLREKGKFKDAIKCLRIALEYSWYAKLPDCEVSIYDRMGALYYEKQEIGIAAFYHKRATIPVLEEKTALWDQAKYYVKKYWDHKDIIQNFTFKSSDINHLSLPYRLITHPTEGQYFKNSIKYTHRGGHSEKFVPDALNPQETEKRFFEINSWLELVLKDVEFEDIIPSPRNEEKVRFISDAAKKYKEKQKENGFENIEKLAYARINKNHRTNKFKHSTLGKNVGIKTNGNTKFYNNDNSNLGPNEIIHITQEKVKKMMHKMKQDENDTMFEEENQILASQYYSHLSPNRLVNTLPNAFDICLAPYERLLNELVIKYFYLFDRFSSLAELKTHQAQANKIYQEFFLLR